MPAIIGSVMSQGTQRERVFVEVLRFANQRDHKISAAHIMRQITKKATAERVISMSCRIHPIT